MAIRSTIQIGHPALKAENRKITSFNSPKTRKLINDLKDTMRKNELIGIAAPQIAESFKVFVTEPRKTKTRAANQVDKFRVYINPTIINYSKSQNVIYEGCGSVVYGKLFGPVKKPKEIVIKAFDEKGDMFQLKCDGILARVIQHEYDHLLGIEFTEKIYNYKLLMSDKFYKKNIKTSKQQVVASKITKIEYIKI